MITKIHDNLPPIKIPIFTIWDWFLLLSILAILIWVYFEFFYINKTKKEKGENKIKKFKSKKFSLEKELKKLKEIEKEGLWKDFAVIATEVLKLVLEQKYKETFLFATGSELVEILEHKKISVEEKEKLKKFFGILDPVKFNKVELDDKKAEKVIEIVKDIWEKINK